MLPVASGVGFLTGVHCNDGYEYRSNREPLSHLLFLGFARKKMFDYTVDSTVLKRSRDSSGLPGCNQTNR